MTRAFLPVRPSLRHYVFAIALVTLTAGVARAQSHDERARMILQLFETGQKDSAYQLIEPLKKEARFAPAVIYTRAQMTPDDRALNLYRETIAIEPGGAWADDAAYQLVRRYVDKRDSAAAYTWAEVLRTNYPRSPFQPMSDQVLAGVTSWELVEETELVAERSNDTRPAPAKVTKTKTETKKGTKTKTTEPAKPAETYRASGMRGYALQVGLFPTRESAEKRATELGKKRLKAVPLPKTVDGKKQFALVIGPYKTIDEAGTKKTAVSTSCDCQAFVVKVE